MGWPEELLRNIFSRSGLLDIRQEHGLLRADLSAAAASPGARARVDPELAGQRHRNLPHPVLPAGAGAAGRERDHLSGPAQPQRAGEQLAPFGWATWAALVHRPGLVQAGADYPEPLA